MSGRPFLLADIGEGIKEVELLQWYVEPGDTVQQFDKICEVQSDKATVEITSRFDGVVQKLAGNVGDMMQVGEPLLFLQQQTDDGHHAVSSPKNNENKEMTGSGSKDDSSSISGKLVEDSIQAQQQDERLQIPTVASQFHLEADDDDESSTAHHARVLTSPAVRKLAREYNLNVGTIKGSGPAGRVLKSDVVTYLQEQGRWRDDKQQPQTEASTVKPSAETTTKAPSTELIQQDEIVQLKGYNRLMVKTMTAALQTPHMSFGDEVVCGELLETRKILNNSSATTSTKISMLALLIKAVDLALTEHRAVNAVVHDVEHCQIKICAQHNIGIAMDTPRGLVVPVIRNCQQLSITDIQHTLDRFKETAGKFTEDDLQGATFTISNIGSVGSGTYMQPVLAPPALAMGALGRIRTIPRFRDDNDVSSVYAAQVLTVTWAADHRFLDGATLGRFHNAFSRYVEQPVTMLAHLK